ncbi:helix-turn-helix domain-containing protein [Limosilactobacillus reuteri]|uniref:HTH cro/C1-type domain-containing protein n=1 Tax=Limosilactobacillus reuteri TaxID=1598 RepID=A0A3M6SEL9_LIMRT|nr:helix-turn-helix transcriptional regulator [Limosilactobacillus reuteri]RMX25751.1 hypothetical protein C5O77_03540 [Limosilactobacillus reuteri]
MILAEEQVLMLKRKRGELNLSTAALGRELGVSRWTLDSIFKRNHRRVNISTYRKLSDWLVKECTKADDESTKTMLEKMVNNLCN